MNRFSLVLSSGVLALAGATAQATITLPTNGNSVRFDGGTMVFDTSIDPTINDANGQLGAPAGPISLTAFGDINHIVNHQSSQPSSGDIGSISADQQLTFALTNAFLVPTDVIASPSNNANVATFTIISQVVGANGAGSGPTLTLYDKDLNAAAGLNTQSFIGGNSALGVPGAATSGASTYLEFANMPDVTATIIVKFTKTGGSTVFNTRTTLLQSFTAAGFPVTGGDVAGLFTIGDSATGNQVQASEVFSTLPGTPVGNDPRWVQGNYALIVSRIPEPASLAMLALGGLLVTMPRRRAGRA